MNYLNKVLLTGYIEEIYDGEFIFITNNTDGDEVDVYCKIETFSSVLFSNLKKNILLKLEGYLERTALFSNIFIVTNIEEI